MAKKLGRKTRSRANPPKESGYDEQNNDDPKINPEACRNCSHFDDNKIITKSTWKAAKWRKAMVIATESQEPVCLKYTKIVDEIFGSCDHFDEKAVGGE